MHGRCPYQQRFPCVQATGHISYVIFFKPGRWVAMAEILPPYCFDTPRVKIMTHQKCQEF